MIEIDEVAFGKAANGCGPALTSRLRFFLEEYLDALPQPEPGRDRIAVVVNSGLGGTADVMPSDPSLFDWEQLECSADEFGCEGPFKRNVVRCTLRTPRPPEPVEVSGIVEEVG
jgi:hypothetical protein